MAGMFALGYLLQRLVINRASHGKDENILLVTLGLSIVLENLALVWFKSDTRSIDTPYALSTVEIGPALIALPKLIAFGGALAVAACLLWLIRGTDLGRAIRAVARESRAPGSWASTWNGSTRCRSASAWPAWARPPVSCCRRTTSIRRSAAASCWWPSPSWCWAAWAASRALAGGLLIGVVESLGGLFLGDSLGQMGIFAIFILVLLFRFRRGCSGKA